MTISRLALPIAALALLPMLPRAALAQTNPAPAHPVLTNVVPQSERMTVQAKITAIDPATRAVTLRSRSGSPVTVIAGPAVRLELLKRGQTVNADYYRSVGFVVTAPRGGNGTPVSNDQATGMMAQNLHTPGGVAIAVTQISGTVVGVDLAAHRIDVVNPSGGGVYTLDVTDPARIAQLPMLKIGDTVTAVVSETLAVSITPAPKSWF
ncbi:MAG TPA: hypothetical protein VHY76_11080 [Acetobacteraceae bacterium]|jgi:hypothetical protein|nr:hypothetical protein [Acetobacteraceae bacterium]